MFQKAAKLAMNLLPTKRGIVLKVVPSGDQPEIEKAYEDFHRSGLVANNIHKVIISSEGFAAHRFKFELI